MPERPTVTARQASYGLTGRSVRMLDEDRARIFDRSRDDWDGTWRMVIYVVPEEDRAERDLVRRPGTGLALAAATWISPHPRLDAVAGALAGLSATRVDLLECRSHGRDTDLDMADRCWDLDGLGRDYLELAAAYEQLPPLAELARLPGPDAIRQQVELPDEVSDETGAGHVGRVGHPAHDVAADGVGVQAGFLLAHAFPEAAGVVHLTGRDDVDAYTYRRPLPRQRTHEAHECGFNRRVGLVGRDCHAARPRSDATTAPEEERRRCGSTRSMRRTAESMSTSTEVRHSRDCALALLTTMSRPPKASTVAAIQPVSAASLPTLTTVPRASP